MKCVNCKTCDSLKIEIKYLHETLGKFIKGGENLDMIQSSHKAAYNKVGLGYEPKINTNNFNNICIAN